MTTTKQKLQDYTTELAKLTKHQDWYFCGDYHEITLSELDDAIASLDDDYEYEVDDILEDMQDNSIFSDLADSSTPIYYSDIAKWFGENYSAVNEYVNEMGTPDSRDFDIMKMIQGGYYISYERDIYQAMKQLLEDYESDMTPEEEEKELADKDLQHDKLP